MVWTCMFVLFSQNIDITGQGSLYEQLHATIRTIQERFPSLALGEYRKRIWLPNQKTLN